MIQFVTDGHFPDFDRAPTEMKFLASMNSRGFHPVHYSRPVAGEKYSREPEFTVSHAASCRTWDISRVGSVRCHESASDNQVNAQNYRGLVLTEWKVWARARKYEASTPTTMSAAMTNTTRMTTRTFGRGVVGSFLSRPQS